MNNFSDPSLLNKQNVEATAIQLLKDVFDENIQFPIDIFEILNMWGIPVEFVNEPAQKYLAKITLTSCPKIFINTPYSMEELVILKQDKTTWHRLRFSIAHELGHNFLKIHNDPNIRKRMKTNFNEPFKKNPQERRYESMTEYQANCFAAELLMPAYAMNNFLNYGNKPLAKAEEISQKFEVSLTAAMFRLAKLSPNIVVCIQINASSGIIEKFEYSKSFSDIRAEHRPYKALFISPRDNIPIQSASNKLLQDNTSSVQGIRNKFPIERWFPSYNGENSLSEWPYIIGDKIITFIEVEQPSELWELGL